MRAGYLAGMVLFCSPISASESPVVAIAANMSYAMSELIEEFHLATGKTIRVSYGSSGNFTRQLLQGAPYELFLSADKKYARQLEQDTDLVKAGTVFVLGRIAFFIPNASGLSKNTGLDAIINALKFGEYQRLVIANPEHAPYGIAAQQALQQAGVWTLQRQALLLAENAAQAAQFSIAGGIDVSIIPYSLAVVPAIAGQGRFFLAPTSWHRPIEQHLLLLQSAGKTAEEFYQYLLSGKSTMILERYGYVIPADR